MIAMTVASLVLGGVVADVPTDALKVKPLMKGSVVPEVETMTLDGKVTKLGGVMGDEAAMVVFYRGGWCPYCNLHLQEMKDALPELKKMGIQLIAVSPDKASDMSATVKQHELDYTLVSDASAAMAKAFGVAFRLDDETYKKYQGYGVDLEEKSGKKHHILPVPSVFLIGEDKKVKWVHANADYSKRLSAKEMIAAAKSL